MLAAAERRAADAGLGNVSFRQARLPDVQLDGLVDCASIASRTEIGPDTLAQRLWAEAHAAGALMVLPELVGAWARTPGA
jgi:hypothetical protein